MVQDKAVICADRAPGQNGAVRQAALGLYVHVIQHVQHADIKGQVNDDTHSTLLVVVAEIGKRAIEKAAADYGSGD